MSKEICERIWEQTWAYLWSMNQYIALLQNIKYEIGDFCKHGRTFEFVACH